MEGDKSFPSRLRLSANGRLRIRMPADQETERKSQDGRFLTTKITLTSVSPDQTRDFTSSIGSSASTTTTSNNTDEGADSPNPNEVSTALCLLDESWNFTRKRKTPENPSDSCGPRKLLCPEARNISKMRIHTEEQRAEEKAKGVSTELKLFTDPWTIKKSLKKSDINGLTRLLLPSNLVREHVLEYMPRWVSNMVKKGDGYTVQVQDHDTDTLHQLNLKKWRKSKSFVLIGNWIKDFVKRRELREEDEIGLYWDRFDHRFHFRVLRRAAAAATRQANQEQRGSC